MQQIVDGNRILIDWMNKLETSMYIGFTLSNGEKLMEYYFLPIVHSHVECVWGFNPFNPFVERCVELTVAGNNNNNNNSSSSPAATISAVTATAATAEQGGQAVPLTLITRFLTEKDLKQLC